MDIARTVMMAVNETDHGLLNIARSTESRSEPCRRDRKVRSDPAMSSANAVHVMKVLTGQIEEPKEIDDGKDPAAKALGRKGGKARAERLTPERRREIARKAAAKRWGGPQ